MDKINSWFKRVNLLLTNTCSKDDFKEKGFDINSIEVTTDNSISLYDLLASFNKMYLAFQKEYRSLKKLPFGESIQIGDFCKFGNVEEESRLLPIYVDSPTFTNHDKTVLYIYEEKGIVSSFAANLPDEITNYHEDVNFDSSDLKGYLDLFEKYALLFRLFKILKFNYLYTDGTNILFSMISKESDDLFDELDSITLRISTLYWMSPENELYIEFNLGKTSGIDYRHSHIKIEDESLKVGMDQYNSILRSIYINGSYLTLAKDEQEEIIKRMKKSIE